MFKRVSDQEIRQYNEDGYLIVPDLFDTQEVERVLTAAIEDKAVHDKTHYMADGAGGITKISGWYDHGDDIYSMVGSCPRVVDNIARLMGEDVYHYQTKLILKDPFEGGAWAWHQDYGYWYHTGYLFPTMASCLMALDRATKENGCLQVLKGSQKLGRMDHILVGEQSGVDQKRLEQAKKMFPLVHCEMEPGSALFFDGNVLHASAQNKSANRRWALICCYTAISNRSYKDPFHPDYEPIKRVPDEAIRDCAINRLGSNRAYFEKAPEKFVKQL